MKPDAIDILLRIEHFPKDRYVVSDGILPDRHNTSAHLAVQKHSPIKCADLRYHVLFQSLFKDFESGGGDATVILSRGQ